MEQKKNERCYVKTLAKNIPKVRHEQPAAIELPKQYSKGGFCSPNLEAIMRLVRVSCHADRVPVTSMLSTNFLISGRQREEQKRNRRHHLTDFCARGCFARVYRERNGWNEERASNLCNDVCRYVSQEPKKKINK